MEKLSDPDINELKYFWGKIGNLEKFHRFEMLMPILKKEKPEVIKAWNSYKAAKKRLDSVINKL